MARIRERKLANGKVTYAVEICRKGFPSKSATFPKLSEGKRWAEDVEYEIRHTKYFKNYQAKKKTASELIDRFIEEVVPVKGAYAKVSQVKMLHWWKKKIGHHTLFEVTPSVISKCKSMLLQESNNKNGKKAGATVNRYLFAIRSVFTTAVKEWGLVEENPVAKVSRAPESKGRTRFLDDDERERLLFACSQSKSRLLYPKVVLAISTGMRYAEIVNLLWKDVDLEKGKIIIQESKNGDKRGIPLVGIALEEIKKLYSEKKENGVFVFQGKRGRPSSCDIHWKLAMQQAKIEEFRFHDLRHCCASYLAMDGASLAEIAEVLGHKSFQMVKRYAHLSESHTSKVVARMNEKIFKTRNNLDREELSM